MVIEESLEDGKSLSGSVDDLDNIDSNPLCRKVVVKAGYLWKCHGAHSSHLSSHAIHMSSRAKYFVLSRGSLDYFRNDKCVKLKGSIPLAIVDAITNVGSSGLSFQLTLSNQPAVVLQAASLQEHAEWAEAIRVGISNWKLQKILNTPKNESDSEQNVENMKEMFPSLKITKHHFADNDFLQIHGESMMIKYARKGDTKTIPHERIIKVDPNNVHVMWRKKSRRALLYRMKSTLKLENIVEVRCGQQTRNFNQFPYLEVEKQSFSLMFEREQGEWCGLNSLDLICDSVLAFQEWKQALKALIYGENDKLPQRKLHDITDPMLVYLQRLWSIVASKYKNRITTESAIHFMQRLSPTTNKRQLRNFVRNITKLQYSEEFVNWESFVIIFNFLNPLPHIFETYKKYAVEYPDLGLTPKEFRNFLVHEQEEEDIDLETCVKLAQHHDQHHLMFKRLSSGDNPDSYQSSQYLLSYHGFLSYLRSKDNSIFDFKMEEVHQNMDQPLSHYFINSSHNTYLTGHQLKGLSSCEAYVRVLQLGCRCLEIDCWNGPEEPMVTHGMTLTSKIKLRDVLEIIKMYAFDASPYPVILSLENHCSTEMQRMMASMFTSIFGDMLATEDLSYNNQLPSPNQLKYKIILKGRPKTKKRSRPRVSTTRSRKYSSTATWFNRRFTSTSLTDLAPSQRSMEDRVNPDRMSISSMASVASVVSTDGSERSEDEIEVLLEDSMSSLIIYCRAVPYKQGEMSLNCFEMHSLGEGTAYVHVDRYADELMNLSKTKLFRTYPRGSRVDSSNYNPVCMWKAGLQMAAINFQKPDSPYHINQGFFRMNGGCGYVLKPEALRVGASAYHPGMTTNIKGVSAKTIEIKVLCGQFVDAELFDGLPVAVELEMIGIDSDCSSSTTEMCSDTFNAVWSKKNIFAFNILMPELCLLYVKVITSNRTVLQNCFPVESLKQGLRYVPMRTLTGVRTPENGMFVRVKIERVTDLPTKKKSKKHDTSSIGRKQGLKQTIRTRFQSIS